MYSPVTGELSVASNRSVVLYHRLTRSNLSRLRKAAQNGLDVACLTADAAIEEQGVDGVCVLGADALPGYWDVIETESLLSVVEIVFDSLARGSTLLPWLRRLYDSSDIDNYFRRVLLNDFGNLFSVASLAAKPPLAGYTSVVLTGNWFGSRIWPFFLDLWRKDDIRTRLAAHLPHPISRGLDRLVAFGEEGIRANVESFARALYHMGRAWYLVLRQLRPYAVRASKCDLLIRTYASDMGINLDGQDSIGNIDFIVDGRELRKERVTFWMERGVSDERKQALLQRGYRLLGADDIVLGPSVFVKHALPMLLSYTALLPRTIKESSWWSVHVADLLYCYITWEEVCHRVKPMAFLAYNDISPIGVARNIKLRQNGCKSIFYQHSCNSPIDPAGTWALNVIYSYLVFDAIATWGPDHSDLCRRHPGTLHEHWEVGCLWSEHARTVRGDPIIRTNYVNQVETYTNIKLASFRKIIGVFDTSITSMLSCDDMYDFVAGSLRLACMLPDVIFLYKPKQTFAEAVPGERVPLVEAFGSKGRQLWERISTTPNFVVLPWLFETASVIGLADLAISACFTSTTVEAIGCGKRAIYYDPTNRFPHAFWRRIPGMVCVTNEELANRVRYLLWDCDEETYTNYLRTYCMGIEGHFDGQAITRLRRQLLDVMNGQQSVVRS